MRIYVSHASRSKTKENRKIYIFPMLRFRGTRLSIMERYRRIRPISLDTEAAPLPHPYQRSSPIESKFFNPSSLPTFTPTSYIRSPVPVSVKVFHPPTAPIIQPTYPRRLRVALIGSPNAGKTSLLNRILDRQVGAVSSKINTTRESIVGVLTSGDCQIEFVDCPGIIPRDGSEDSKHLAAEAWTALNDSDYVLFLADTVKKPTPEFLSVIRKVCPKPTLVDELADFVGGKDELAQPKKGVALLLNKSDLVEDRKWLKVRNMQLSVHGAFETCFFVSAKEGHNVNKIVDFLKQKCEPGDWRYAADTVTTLSMTDQLEQLIRGCLFTWFNKDVPYRISQQTVGWTERLDGTLVIEHELIVKDSVVARMILGTKNRLLQRLRENVIFKLKKMWNMENIVLLIHLKALEQRESKKDKIDRSKREDLGSFLSRGSGRPLSS